jgi:hypothetical protein
MQSAIPPQFSPRFTQSLQAGGSNSRPVKPSGLPAEKATIKPVKFGGNPFEKIKNTIAEFFALIIAYIFALGLKRKAEQPDKTDKTEGV